MKKFLVSMVPLFSRNIEQEKIPGYMICSTAPMNVEDDNKNPEILTDTDPLKTLRQIAEYIYEKSSQGKNIEIVTQIHGFNTPYINSKKAYGETNKWIQDEIVSDSYTQLIFFGYSWPSEGISLSLSAIFQGYKALPLWLQILMWLGFLLGFIDGIYVNFINSSNSILSILCAVVATLCLAPVITLMLLRLSTYFRDSYRANNYGVVDLILLFKAFEQELFDVVRKDSNNSQTPKEYWNNHSIKLSFIGHSMGGFVVTNLVRSLADVFDKNLIINLEIEEYQVFENKPKPQTSKIGDCFSLERLILASPDIPVDTILSGRSNFLVSSLLRFQECYLFSNEGDTVLLMASTAANYFTYPAKTSQKGYKLGNLGLRSDGSTSMSKYKYGIINLFDKMHSNQFNNFNSVFNRLVVGVDHSYLFKKINVIAENTDPENQEKIKQELEKVAKQFTYFDCTDFDYKKEVKNDAGYIRKSDLNVLNYVILTMLSFCNLKDVHGGYFRGEFTKNAIYKLAFLGIKPYLLSFNNVSKLPEELKNSALTTENYNILDSELKKHNIRVLLKPTLLPTPNESFRITE